MINTKKIYNELLNDVRILQLVNDENIFDAYPETVESFPCVIFLDENQRDSEFADNFPMASDCSVTIHIFTKAENNYPTTSEIGIVIGEVFKENYFTCDSNNELSDVQKDVRHRVMSFRKQMLSIK